MKPTKVVASDDNMVEVVPHNLLSERGELRNRAVHLSVLLRDGWNAGFVREILSPLNGRQSGLRLHEKSGSAATGGSG